MPVYEYQCRACEHAFEEWQKITEPPVKTCPKCAKDEVERLISQTAFQLKGGGWYKDLYSSSKSDKGNGKSESKADGKSDAKADSKADAKGSTDAKSSSSESKSSSSESKAKSSSDSKASGGSSASGSGSGPAKSGS